MQYLYIQWRERNKVTFTPQLCADHKRLDWIGLDLRKTFVVPLDDGLLGRTCYLSAANSACCFFIVARCLLVTRVRAGAAGAASSGRPRDPDRVRARVVVAGAAASAGGRSRPDRVRDPGRGCGLLRPSGRSGEGDFGLRFFAIIILSTTMLMWETEEKVIK